MKEWLAKYFKGDRHIWAILFLLSIISVLAVYSSSSALSYRISGGSTAFLIFQHIMFLAIGFSAAFVVHWWSVSFISRWTLIAVVISIVLLVITLFFGRDVNAANRSLSFLGRSFQTSDLAKITVLLYVAQQLAAHQNDITNLKSGILKPLICLATACVLILPANLSTAALLFVVGFMVMFIGRVKISHLALIGGGSMLAAFCLVACLYFLHEGGIENRFTQRANTWKLRVERYFSDEEELNTSSQRDANYQSELAKMAVSTGGVFGKGVGKSELRNSLPHSYSDFIYAIILEEYGIVGGSVVLALYLALLYRSILIVRKCKKTFPALLTMSMALIIVFQALMHMAVSVAWMPVTGQPLPFISMGGTSILFTGVAFGLILSVSRENNKEELEPTETLNMVSETEPQSPTSDEPQPEGQEEIKEEETQQKELIY